MRLHSKTSKGFFLSCLMALTVSIPAAAQTITETTPLNFGTIVVISYGAVGRVTLSPSGSYSYNSNVYLIDPPQLGEYHVSGATPNAFFTVTLPSTVSITGPGGPFELDTLEVRPVTLTTNALGEADFTISGRLQTLGGGTPYYDGNYTTNFTISLVF